MTQTLKLSRREKEVTELLLQGKSNKQIALVLGIAESTVEFHLKNVYVKLKVGSRTEAVLKLGKSTGLLSEQPGESIVEKERAIDHTGGTFVSEKCALFLSTNGASAGKVIEMKDRLLFYFRVGLVFGVLFWFYFSAIGKLANTFGFSIDEENVLAVWAFLTTEFLFIFGVWLIPTIYPALHEFRRSRKIRSSVKAVIVTWVSAILGYYLIYVVLLVFVGLPNMEHYSVLGQHGPAFWHDWAGLFLRLILSKLLKWIVIGTVVGGTAGLVTSWLYSFWIRKTNTILPA